MLLFQYGYIIFIMHLSHPESRFEKDQKINWSILSTEITLGAATLKVKAVSYSQHPY